MCDVICNKCRKNIITMTPIATNMLKIGNCIACLNCGNIHTFTKENLENKEELEYNTVEVVV